MEIHVLERNAVPEMKKQITDIEEYDWHRRRDKKSFKELDSYKIGEQIL